MTTACLPPSPACLALTNSVCPASLVPDDDRDAVARRLAEWRPSYKLATREHEDHFEQLVLSSIRLERCREQESALRHCERAHAQLRWDEDRRAEAETLAKGLSRRPSLVASQLRQTRQGVEWMIERWRALGLLLEQQKGEWNKAQKALALDLTGTPKELRLKDPVFENPAALVAAEIARLERLKAQSLDAMDVLERDMARAGTPVTTSAAMEKLRRHEATCLRESRRAAEALRTQRVTPPPAAPASAPQPATEPIRCEAGKAEAVRTTPPPCVPDARTSTPVLPSALAVAPIMKGTGSPSERFRS